MGACGEAAAHGGDGRVVAGLGGPGGSCPWPCGFWEPLEGFIRGVTTSDVRCGMNVIALVGSTPTGATRGQGGSRQQSPGRWRGGGLWTSQGRRERSRGPGDGGDSAGLGSVREEWTDPQVSNWVAGENLS